MAVTFEQRCLRAVEVERLWKTVPDSRSRDHADLELDEFGDVEQWATPPDLIGSIAVTIHTDDAGVDAVNRLHVVVDQHGVVRFTNGDNK